MDLRRIALTSCLVAFLPLQAIAQDKLAYVIGNTRFGGPALKEPTKDAVSISRALLGLGYDVVRRENVTANDFPLGTRAAQTVALYYSGRTSMTEEGDILLRGAQLGDAATPGWPVLGTARAFQQAGAENVLIFVETCQGDGDSIAALPEDTDMSGILLAVSHNPDDGCPLPEPEPEEAAVEDAPASAETAEGEETIEADAAEDTSETDPAAEIASDAEPEEESEPAPRFTERVRLALATPDSPIGEALSAAAGAGWISDNLAAPVYMWPQSEGETGAADSGSLPAGALDMLANLPEAEAQRMRTVWQEAGLIDAEGNIVDRTGQGPTTTILVGPETSSSGITIVAPVSTPVSPVIPQNAPGGTRVAGRIAPVQQAAQRAQGSTGSSSGTGTGGTGSTNAVQIFTPTPRAAAPAALPTAAGLPEPYLIFGEIRPINASFDPTETGEVQGSAIDTSLFEERNRIRNETPDFYQQLVESGAFDPDDGSERGLARAIQTELARMSCYTAGIDGIWGNGSRRSVSAYFEQISETPTELEPTLSLYRKIILNDDVSCPVVQQAAPAARSTSTGGGTTTRRSTPAPARSQPAAPAPRPSTGGGINTNNLGTGIFR